MASINDIARMIDESPMNRGMVGHEWLKDPDNLALTVDGNTMLFTKHGPTVEFHWLDTPNKGRLGMEATRKAMRRALVFFHAELIYGLIPKHRRDSMLMARWIGAVRVGPLSTEQGLCEIYAVTRQNLEG